MIKKLTNYMECMQSLDPNNVKKYPATPTRDRTGVSKLPVYMYTTKRIFQIYINNKNSKHKLLSMKFLKLYLNNLIFLLYRQKLENSDLHNLNFRVFLFIF